MTKHKTRWLLVGLVCLALWPAHASAQGGLWETYMAPGAKAYEQAMATDLNNLALLYQAQGRYAEAEPLYKRALAIREKALGAEHPDVAQSLNNLAALYHDQGRYAEAEPLYERSLAIREKVLGPEHPYTARSLENYAALLSKTGRADEATGMEGRAKAIRARHAQDNPVE